MDGKVSMVFNRNGFPNMTDFSRLGALQVVTYTLKVVVSKKALADLRFLEGVTLGTRASEAIERALTGSGLTGESK